MSQYARRVDSNQAEIVAAFRFHGCSVKLMHAAGKGFPDLAVGRAGITTLVEVKAGKGKLNDRQKEWLDDWTGGHDIARDIGDVERIVARLRDWHLILTTYQGREQMR